MSSTTSAADFLALHKPGSPLIMPNPWDVGTARIFEWLGFKALATTSAGFAATLGRRDGNVTVEEVLNHAAELVAATTIPISADLENGFASDTAGLVETYTAAIETGLAGGSLEDYSGTEFYSIDEAADRVAAAASVTAGKFVLTARAENHIRGNPDLADTIARLQRYQEAGADVLFAPGVRSAADVRTLLSEVDLPVNVILLPGGVSMAEYGELGVARFSVGSCITNVALAAVVDAGRELLAGDTSFLDRMGSAGEASVGAFLDKE